MPALIPVATDGVAVRTLAETLSASLDGGAPIAPLPTAELERQQVLKMLQPDRPVVEPDAAVVVATSGSTGNPKGVVLTRRGVVASAEATHRRLGGAGDWLLALPAHYVAGLMVLARAVVAGTRVHPIGSDLAGLTEVVGDADPRRRRYLSVVPTQLVRALADRELSRTLSRLDAVLLGGAAAAPALLDRARDAGIAVRVTYGMSETCGGCVYDGVPLDGVGIRIADPGTDFDSDTGLDSDGGGAGRIEVEGEPVFAGYRLRPDLTADALVDDGALDVRPRFRTQDRGRMVDGRLNVLGRIDDVVVSGGLNVDLAAVERAARELDLAAGGELVVIAVPDAEWGSRVVAVTDADRLDQEQLRRRLGTAVPAHAVPRDLVRRATLPRTSSGKVDRRALVAELIEAGAAAGSGR